MEDLSNDLGVVVFARGLHGIHELSIVLGTPVNTCLKVLSDSVNNRLIQTEVLLDFRIALHHSLQLFGILTPGQHSLAQADEQICHLDIVAVPFARGRHHHNTTV